MSQTGPTIACATDEARLETLNRYEILDTAPEPGFDAIVREASRTCAAPVALVTLVDRERQWFKARHGLEQTETVLDQSVCAHALGSRELLVIPDLSLDPRTAANPLVTGGSHLRFYAGAPLVAPNGHVLGTLCVVDDVPRPAGLSPEQADRLRALAGEVMGELERRRAAEKPSED
ncbi:GAF domain-containing protein [Aureimonas sp. AU22]|jgi:GAF domain-containing protein|uniref:GAF domain-containing protein n=1 Tax=Aureimonas sp. AU22 TaxID=1638162 RepID=UPI00078363C0|nr:GAF domain-containing protein [Aureimonas sp. AU22]